METSDRLSAARHSAASPGIAFPVKRGSGAHVVYGLAASRQEVANGSCVLAYLTGLAEAVRSLRSRENSKCSPGPGEGRENRVFLTAKIPASVAGHAFALRPDIVVDEVCCVAVLTILGSELLHGMSMSMV